MLPRILSLYVPRRKWQQHVKFNIFIYYANGETFLFKYSFNYEVTKVNFLARNYFVYSSEQFNFNVSISKRKELGKALNSFSPSASKRTC